MNIITNSIIAALYLQIPVYNSQRMDIIYCF